MEQSQFIQMISKWFGPLVLSVITTINGTKDTPTTYLHKRMLKKKFSVSGTWKSFLGTYTRIRADVVSMNSPMPLKKRDSMGQASGDIPKMGLEFQLNEQQLTEIDTMVALNTEESTIVAQIFQDAKRGLESVPETNESIFLEGLSTGVCEITDDENSGTSIRIDYGFPNDKKFGATVVWSTPVTATPLDDIQRMVDVATSKGDTLAFIKMDKTAMNNAVKTKQLKEEYAFNIGYTGDILRSPTQSKFAEILQEKFGVSLEIVDRSVRYEKNGIQTVYKPWADGAVVGLTTEDVGSLVYARLAEENRPVPGVSYQKADDFILLSLYRQNKPLAEFTTVQARVIPVISAPVYLLDTKTAQA